MKMFISCFLFAIIILVIFSELSEFLRMKFSDVLEDNTDVFGVEGASEFVVVCFVLKDDRFTEVVDWGGV